MKFIPSAFTLLLIFLSHQPIPCFGTTLVEDVSLEDKGKGSPHLRRSCKPNQKTTISRDPLALLMPEMGGNKGRTGNFTTIAICSPNMIPREILNNDLRLLLEGKEVTILGRKAYLHKDSLKLAEILKSQDEMVAKVDETNRADGTQRLGGKLSSSSSRKKMSGKYAVFAKTENSGGKKISLNIILKVYFSK